jgi:glycosyltransferase involved in cell wall biosynthesis
MKPRISVVTPSFNQGRFIERTILSVLSQDPPGGMEYLVMDGGSRDETVEILKRYGDRLFWVSEKDSGQTDAVNKGMARASGEIIGWLNSDDIYYPGTIAAACQVFDSDPAIDLVYGDANHIDENDQVIEAYPTEEMDFSRLLETCYFCQPAVFLRKSVIDRFGPLNHKLQFCMDYEYWLRLAAAGARFRHIPKVFAGSRLYAETKTMGSRVKVHAEINDMLRSHVRRVPDQWLFNWAHAVIDEKRVSRSDRRFPLLVAAWSLYASLRWNRQITSRVAATSWQWTALALQSYCRGGLVR